MAVAVTPLVSRDNMATAMTEPHGFMMANYEATVLGETVSKAQWRLEQLGTLAPIQHFSRIGVAPHTLSADFESCGPLPAKTT